jgi:hypothetical protein
MEDSREFANTSSFGVPNALAGDPAFGSIGVASRPRDLQLGLKAIFRSLGGRGSGRGSRVSGPRRFHRGLLSQ